MTEFNYFGVQTAISLCFLPKLRVCSQTVSIDYLDSLKSQKTLQINIFMLFSSVSLPLHSHTPQSLEIIVVFRFICRFLFSLFSYTKDSTFSMLCMLFCTLLFVTSENLEITAHQFAEIIFTFFFFASCVTPHCVYAVHVP